MILKGLSARELYMELIHLPAAAGACNAREYGEFSRP
jgi:hypothetical protein